MSDLPFEDHCDLLAIARFDLQGINVGAYLLETKQLSGSQYSFVFGFRYQGFHNMPDKGAADRFLQRLDIGMRKMQPNQKLRVHFSSFAQDVTAQQELSGAFCITPRKCKFHFKSIKTHIESNCIYYCVKPLIAAGLGFA